MTNNPLGPVLMTIASLIAIAGALTSTVWLSLIGVAAMTLAWLLKRQRRIGPADVVVDQWHRDPRPAPTDVVDRH